MLCLGSFLQLIVDCANTGQKEIVGFIMTSFDSNFDDTDDSKISNLVLCNRNPSREFRNMFMEMKREQYPEVVQVFKRVIPKIHPNKMRDLKQGFIKQVVDDSEIKNDTVVDLVNEVDKAHMSENNNPLESILAGIFIYVLMFTTNTINRNAKKVKSITSLKSKNQYAPLKTESNIADEIEDVFIDAQDFCLKHEKEIGLLPLCQIAFNSAPLHNNLRDMYTDYSRCSQKVKEKILDLNDIPLFTFSKDWIEDALENYILLIKRFNLSSERYVYIFFQYFHRAFDNYSNESFENPDPYIFDGIFKNQSKMFSSISHHLPIGGYIGDYLWGKKENPNLILKPPLDYLWDYCNLGKCDEPILTFWICRFIISSSFHLCDYGVNVKEFWKMVDVDEELLKRQEDMYYYALMQLYLLTLNPEDLQEHK